MYRLKIYFKHSLITFLLGFYGYPLIEILWRGYSHFSMAITGGICFFTVYCFCNLSKTSTVIEKCMIGALLITGIELLSGVAVNGFLKLNVWDYSNVPFNLFGQICLPYYFLWTLLMLPVSVLSVSLKNALSQNSDIMLYDNTKAQPNNKIKAPYYISENIYKYLSVRLFNKSAQKSGKGFSQ